MADDPQTGDISRDAADQSAAELASSGARVVAAPTKAEKPKSKIPLRETEFFGPRGWLGVVLPYLVMLVGLGLAGYLENARAFTQVKHIAEECNYILEQVMQAMSQQNPGNLDRLEQEFQWKPLVEDLKLIGMGEHFEFDDFEGRALLALSSFDELGIPGKQQLKERFDFLFRLLDYDRQGKTRAIISESFERQQKMLEAAGQPLMDRGSRWFPNDRSWYPTTYSMTIVLTTLITLIAIPKLFRVPFRISPLAIGVGAVGIVVWLALWWVGKYIPYLSSYIHGRDAFNPFTELQSDPGWMYTFLGIRVFGLVLLVPVVEEFFLRGFLTRYIDHPDWDRVPIDYLSKLSISGIAVYAVFTHTPEPIAAVAWFMLITYLFIKTKNLWDCVIAHSVTNLLLGIFVLTTGTWELW